jgi:hypothetical protein
MLSSGQCLTNNDRSAPRCLFSNEQRCKKIGLALLIFSKSSLLYASQVVPRTCEYERCMDRAGAFNEAIIECETPK